MSGGPVTSRRCGRCGQPLSRHNTADTCGACDVAARDRPAPPVRLEPGFWNRPDIRSALIAHDWRTLLTEVHKASGASQMRIATATGVSQSHISRILSGRVTDPSFSMVMAILTGLGAPLPTGIHATAVPAGSAHSGRITDASSRTGGYDDRNTPSHSREVAGTGSDHSPDDSTHGDDDHPADAFLLYDGFSDEGDATKRRELLKAGMLAGASPWIPTPSAGRVSAPMITAIADAVAHAQRLDDRQGGAARTYVAEQAHLVERILRRDHYTPVQGRTLSALLAQLAQTAGFMEFDACRDKAARDWYRFGLDASRHADDPSLTASILSLMSNQSAACGLHAEAIELAVAAEGLAAQAPPLVRALISARSGLAFAAAGDLRGVLRRRDTTRDHTARAQADPEPAPAWAYYVSDTELDAINGRSLVSLIRRLPKHATTLLPQAEDLLRGRALAHDTDYDRSGLRHSAWLALAHIHGDQPEQAVIAGHRALDRLPAVHSPRSLELLRELRSDLAAYRGVQGVDDLTADLNARLPAGISTVP